MTTPPATAKQNSFEHEIRVGWGDCDPAKIAYTARIPWWALESIDAWWEHHLGGFGWFQLNVDRDLGTPFVHMAIDFRSPVTPRHRLICKVAPTKLGTSSITFRVEGYQDGILCFEGTFVNVFVIASAFKPQKAPDDVRAVVEALIV